MFKITLILGLSLASFVGSTAIARKNWRKYIALYLSSSIVGMLLCYGFVEMGFYFFPFRLFPIPIPLLEMMTILPFIVLVSVHYSPARWGFKIPFYWTIVHILMFLEVLSLFRPFKLIEYRTVSEWNVWSSYTWWWIYLLVFEYVGELIIPASARNPIDSAQFRYGTVVWLISHFILISTIFLAGVYLGYNMKAK